MTDQGKAYLYGLGAVLLWSTMASAFKLSLRYLDPPQLLLYASLTAIVVLTLNLGARRKLGLVFSCTRRQYARSFVLGLLNPVLYYLVLLRAYDLLPAQVAQPLNYTWAIALPLLSIPLLRQRIRWWEIAAGLVCYSGALVISTHGNVASFRFDSPLGVALALGSAVVWALYWIYNTKDERDPVVGLLLGFLFGTPLVLIYCVVFSDPRVTSVPGLIGAAYVGVAEMGVGFVLWLKALKLSENTARVGNLIFIAPFLSLALIRLFVGEDILASTFGGLLLIVAGLVLQGLGRREAGGRTPA